MSVSSILTIGFGGAVGAVFRVLMIGVVNRTFSARGLPLGTLAVNVLGGFYRLYPKPAKSALAAAAVVFGSWGAGRFYYIFYF